MRLALRAGKNPTISAGVSERSSGTSTGNHLAPPAQSQGHLRLGPAAIPAALGRTRLAQLALFLLLARVAHRGSRLSAVRWAQDHAVGEVLGLDSFDEDDLYAALDDLSSRQEKIEQKLFQSYLLRKEVPPRLFLYDVTSSYLEGEQNALGEFGYNRDGKKGRLQIVIGLLTDAEGEPLAVRVFSGNTADPTTAVEQIKILLEKFQVQEFVFVGNRGMVKSKGIEALQAAHLRYITALTDPQIRRLLGQKVLQLDLFSEKICEVEGEGVRYVLRKNEREAARERHRMEDKLGKLARKVAARNEEVEKKERCKPEAGRHKLQAWAERHKLAGLVELKLEGDTLVLERHEEKIEKALELAGCYVMSTDVWKESMSAQEKHDSYLSLQKVERDFRTLKTGLLEEPYARARQAALPKAHHVLRDLRTACILSESSPHYGRLRDSSCMH